MSNVIAAKAPHLPLSSKMARFTKAVGWTVLGVGTASFSMALAVGIDLHVLPDSMQLVLLCLALAGPAAGAAILLVMKSVGLAEPENSNRSAYYVLIAVRIIASLAAAAFIMAATATVFYFTMVALIA